MSSTNSSALARVAILGNHPPRKCGIATFTEHLAEAISKFAPDLQIDVVAMSDRRGYRYPKIVQYQIQESSLDNYRNASKYLNIENYDVLSVQHEYGIYGGEAGAYLLNLLREVKMPIVTTLHTVLEAPSDSQRRVMDELIQLSESVIVMTKKGADILERVHKLPKDKIKVIPHGVPVRPETSAETIKQKLGIANRPMIMTFGLLSPDKGIELMIEAMAEIVKAVPDAVYVVVGATHPHIKRHSGESYRKSLLERAKELGLLDNVRFVDRFVDEDELVEMICAADLYVTPYQKEEQITSGTLAYAVGLGKAVISTPYWHAQELLSEGRGVLVPFRGSKEMAEVAIQWLTDSGSRKAFEERAAQMAKTTIWPAVAQAYLNEFWTARTSSASSLRAVVESVGIAKSGQVSTPSLNHLFAMTDDTGLLQHATFSIPNRSHGYCIDDNARAFILSCMLQPEPGSRLDQCQATYLAFMLHGLNEDNGRFRNFMSHSRNWLESEGSEDSHCRTLWALGTGVSMLRKDCRRQLCISLFRQGAEVVSEFTSPRAWAYAILGACKFLESFPGDRTAETLRDDLAERLCSQFRAVSAEDWQWFENELAYCNARLSQALIEAGTQASRIDWLRVGFISLDWLSQVQTNSHGLFAPIGTEGFYVRDGHRAIYDQQPVEAWSTISANLSAWKATRDDRWLRDARNTLAWFKGANSIGRSLVDDDMGLCRDGLHLDRVNQNCGAESTLSYLSSWAEMQIALGQSAKSGEQASIK